MRDSLEEQHWMSLFVQYVCFVIFVRILLYAVITRLSLWCRMVWSM